MASIEQRAERRARRRAKMEKLKAREAERRAEPKTKIACAGCGRTEHVRASKIVPCDGYTCSMARCKQNPAFKIPKAPEGDGCALVDNAAGAFWGWIIRPATEEEKRDIERARAILHAGIAQVNQEQWRHGGTTRGTIFWEED